MNLGEDSDDQSSRPNGAGKPDVEAQRLEIERLKLANEARRLDLETEKFNRESAKTELEKAKLTLELEKLRSDLGQPLRELGASRAKITADYALAAIRSVFLVNGGAAIGMLAFLGQVSSRGRAGLINIEKASNGLGWFAYGVAFASVALILGYLSRLLYKHIPGASGNTPRSSIMQGVAIFSGLVGLCSFGLGVLRLQQSFNSSAGVADRWLAAITATIDALQTK